MIYDYRKNIKEDIKEYLQENYSNEELKEKSYDSLYDVLWIADSVTGNASGSYTCNIWEAEDCLNHNYELVSEAIEEFGGDY